jgi:hypothetical protein
MEPNPALVIRRADLLANGIAKHEIRALYASGEWQRLARGAYVVGDGFAELDERSRHLLRILAVVPNLAAGSVVSHDSAAVLHGLPLLDVDLSCVHVTRNRRGGGRTTAGVVFHSASLGETTEIEGIRVTSVARTLADIARTRSLDTAVSMGDAVLRCGMDPGCLKEELDRARKWKGVAQARRVASMLDGRSESVGESLGRIRLLQSGFTDIDLQVEIYDEEGRHVARTDYLLGARVVTEFDGKEKYQRFRRPGQSAGDAVFEEKKREDRIRELGYPVVRFTWADLFAFDRVAKSVHRAVDQAARMPVPRGSRRRTVAGAHPGAERMPGC